MGALFEAEMEDVSDSNCSNLLTPATPRFIVHTAAQTADFTFIFKCN